MLITVITNQGGVHVCTAISKFDICGKSWLRLETTSGTIVDVNPSYVVEISHVQLSLQATQNGATN